MKKPKAKILVVDDDEDILAALQLVLETEGYEAITDNGRTIDKKLNAKPELILLDMILPEIDGRILAEKIKSQIDFNNIPIIFMSAHPTASINYKKYGADAFLEKPFNNDQLLRLIRKYTKKPN